MSDFEISDPLFREAVQALDEGNVKHLKKLLTQHPKLVQQRANNPDEGYFKNPYLLWFVAQNPIRAEKMPANIVDAAKTIIDVLKHEKAPGFRNQLNYTLALVCSGRVPRECGLQIPLIDLLIDEGADPNKGDNAALVHREMEAVNRLLERGAVVTLNLAVGTDRMDEFERLVENASPEQLQEAIAVAAFFGRPRMLVRLIERGADVNAFNPNGFHSHSQPLHQAVFSGSMDAVKILVEAGAQISTRDKIHQGTPLGWAEFGGHTEIAAYLRKAKAGKIVNELIRNGIVQPKDLDKAMQIISSEIES